MRLGGILLPGAIGLASLSVLLSAATPASVTMTPTRHHPAPARQPGPATSGTANRLTGQSAHQTAIPPSSCTYVHAHLAQYAARGIHQVVCVATDSVPLELGP